MKRLGLLRDQVHEQLAGDAHPVTLDLGAGVAPQPDRLVVAEVDADLLEDVERGLVDQLEALIVEDLVHRDGALQHRQRSGAAARSSPPGARPGRRDAPHALWSPLLPSLLVPAARAATMAPSIGALPARHHGGSDTRPAIRDLGRLRVARVDST